MSYSKIGRIEAIALVCVGILNHIILNLSKNIVHLCGPSSIINCIYVVIIGSIFLYFIVKLFSKFPENDIVDISEFLGGKILKAIISVLYLILIFVMNGLVLRNFTEALKITYFSTFKLPVLIGAITLCVAISLHFGKRSISKINLMIIPSLLLTIIVICLFSIPNFSASRIFPILGYGAKETFLIGLSNIFALNGLMVLFFLPPLLKEKRDFKKISYISLAIVGAILVLSITCILLSLPFASYIDELSPIYLLLRVAEFGSFFQRPEGLFIFIWILSLLSFLCVFTMITIIILKKLFNLKNGDGICLPLCSVIFITSLLPYNLPQSINLESSFYKYFSIIVIYIITFAVLILANIKKKRQIRPKGGENSNE